MIKFNAYLLLENTKQKDDLISILDLIFQDYYLSWDNNIARIEVIDDPAFVLKLEKVNSSAFTDFNLKVSILVVPYFDSLFIKYLKKLNNEVLTLYDIFLRNITSEETKKDSHYLISQISPENINTIQAYLKSNGSLLKASEELYLHRNSYLYRIKKFTEETQIDYNDLNNLLFLKLIFSIVK